VWVSRPVALLLPDIADKLQQLAGRLDTLEPGQVIGELEAIKATVLLAASSAAVSPRAPDPLALLMTDEAVGEVLGVPARTVVLLRQRGLLPGVPVGDKYIRTRRRDLEAFVASLPTARYSQKYASQPHARPPGPLDAGGDVCSPEPSPRLDAGRARRRVRHH
jgi:hypothetical protein